ncbi:acetylxylan esterase [Ravibacter arvi]
MKKRVLLALACFFVGFVQLAAQPAQQYVQVIVAPDRADWTYKTGEPARFNVSVFKDGVPLKGASVSYEIGLEKLKPTEKATKTASNGTLSLEGGTLKVPGFLRCVAQVTVDGVTYRGLGTAGYSPDKIVPTVENPGDFDAFWRTAKQELATIPLDAKMTLMPERCTEKVNVYHLSLQNFKIGNRLYGILCVPKAPGKYPALLQVPGAGVRGYAGDIANAEKGIITLQIGIHGIPVDLPAQVYEDLRQVALNGYNTYNMDDKDRFYFKRVYLGCVRANDFLTSMPEYDGQNLAVTGGSQGGALSVITAALDSRVKLLGAFYPALSDVTGYLHGRAGGWPHYFTEQNLAYNNTKAKLETLPYYDVVNFARRVKVPGYYSWGYNDETCPPTSMHAFYNVTTAPKELFLAYDTGHWMYPEQRNKMNNWLVSRLKNGGK